MICIAMFTVCSFLCGIATSLPQLIIFRLMQGFFGGGLQPNQQSIILDTFPPAKRGAAFGVTAIATIVAPVLGPDARRLSSPTTTIGAGSSSLNCRSASSRYFFVSLLVEDPPWAEEQAKPRHRLYRPVADHARPRLPADHDGPRRGRRLVRIPASSG